MNAEFLKTKAQVLIVKSMDRLIDLKHKGEPIDPQGFFVIQTKDDELSLSPIDGFEVWYRHQGQENMMQEGVEGTSKNLKASFKNGEKILAFSWTAEAFYLQPELNDEKKDCFFCNIYFIDKIITLGLPFTKLNTQIFFEPIVVISEGYVPVTGLHARFLDA